MGLTVGNYAANYYNTYSFENSTTYANNKIDSLQFSKDTYNVSNMTNALDSLDGSASASFATMISISAYAQNAYKESQLSNYDDLQKKVSQSSGVVSLLNDTASPSIDDVLSIQRKINVQTVKNIIEKAKDMSESDSSDQSTISDYSAYVSNGTKGSILDVFA